MKLFFIMTLLVSNVINAQAFQTPESAAFDSSSNRYFISNYGDGNIIQLDSAGNKSYFKTGLSKSLGMIIKDDILYVVSNPKMVKGFRLSDASQVFEIEISEGLFLNDITSDDSGFLYVTDSRLKAVFKIDLSKKTYSLFVKTELDNPNGIIFDKANNRLVMCYFEEDSPIDQITLKDAVRTEIIKPGFDNLDGIAIDELGNFYISSWGAGSFSTGFKKEGTIYKFDNQFSVKPKAVSTGHHGPADIFYSLEKSELIIPLFMENDINVKILTTLIE
ncbi:SMP-30/gluconolactonase/LRE family protein [Teredinibacter haidensis]|uniref:SMP-30/gluconolactonase/LRE family protein n=1 Tax=Teredinibacter haidensis TaxID=2731755 RepID=UPI000948E3E0|nr:SMP-30/gluconolactonase/LRE family protein [Teredinibacter haidensis]